MGQTSDLDRLGESGRSAAEGPQLVVMAPSLMLEISLERSPADETEIHLHAGGQGFWVARMAHGLGAQVRLCTTLGGESGEVLRGLVERTGFALQAVRSGHFTASYIEDRRGEERTELGATPVPPLGRHEIDELYGMTLAAGLDSDGVLITGPRTEDQLDRDFYRRLVGDLRTNGVFVGADLSGEALKAAIEPGLDFLKVSDEELVGSGLAADSQTKTLIEAMGTLADTGVERLVVSRGDEPGLAMHGGLVRQLNYPPLEPLEPRGTGDSIFAGVATQLIGGADWDEAIRIGTAAGTLNVTRRGLGKGNANDIHALADRIELRSTPETS
jgi:1-phosphofructokinase